MYVYVYIYILLLIAVLQLYMFICRQMAYGKLPATSYDRTSCTKATASKIGAIYRCAAQSFCWHSSRLVQGFRASHRPKRLLQGSVLGRQRKTRAARWSEMISDQRCPEISKPITKIRCKSAGGFRRTWGEGTSWDGFRRARGIRGQAVVVVYNRPVQIETIVINPLCRICSRWHCDRLP